MSLEEKNNKRNCELENFVNLEPRVCEELLYTTVLFKNSMSANKVRVCTFLFTAVAAFTLLCPNTIAISFSSSSTC